MSHIRNTTTDMGDRAHQILFLAAGAGAVGQQEMAGQRQLLASGMLPADIRGANDAELAALGFTLGEADPRDPLFRRGSLPPGWSLRPMSDPRGSHLLDEHGRERGEIFYKAAFYDRKATLSLHSLAWHVARQVRADAPIVTDETWATPQAVEQALRTLAGQEDELADEQAQYGPRWMDDAKGHRAAAARYRARLAEIEGGV